MAVNAAGSVVNTVTNVVKFPAERRGLALDNELKRNKGELKKLELSLLKISENLPMYLNHMEKTLCEYSNVRIVGLRCKE